MLHFLSIFKALPPDHEFDADGRNGWQEMIKFETQNAATQLSQPIQFFQILRKKPNSRDNGITAASLQNRQVEMRWSTPQRQSNWSGVEWQIWQKVDARVSCDFISAVVCFRLNQNHAVPTNNNTGFSVLQRIFIPRDVRRLCNPSVISLVFLDDTLLDLLIRLVAYTSAIFNPQIKLNAFNSQVLIASEQADSHAAWKGVYIFILALPHKLKSPINDSKPCSPATATTWQPMRRGLVGRRWSNWLSCSMSILLCGTLVVHTLDPPANDPAAISLHSCAWTGDGRV
jgi:hypothetical protein